MTRIIIAALVALCAAVPASADDAKLPAFPGAEGYGAPSVGGRGGKVVKVTNLNESGPGSFRHACEEETGPRTIVFDVSGVIPGPKGRKYREVVLRDSRVTIAGQTSPGGITFEGLLRIRGEGEKLTEDIIVRHIRLRPFAAYAGSPGGPSANTDCLGLNYVRRAIIDHVSVSWGCDESIDLINSHEVTLQWSTIEESDIQFEGGDEPHNFALILGYSGGKYSIHHNLFAHHHDRAPAFTSLKQECDFVNNVLYNFGTGCSTPFGNLVGNYCKAGPGAAWGYPRMYHPVATLTLPACTPYKRSDKQVYMRGNYLAWSDGYFDAPARGPALADNPIPTAPLTIHPAEEAYARVLASAGALPHDTATRRTVYEVRTGTGAWGRHDVPGGVGAGLDTDAKPLPDGDGDGMPDAWEKAHRLDPSDPSDGSRAVPAGASDGDRHKGYTYLEFYLNDLADRREAAARKAEPGDWTPPPAVHEKPRKPIDQLVADITSQDANRKQTDTETSFHAIYNLSRMDPAESAKAIPGLLAALPTDDKRRAVFVCWALGAIGQPGEDVVPALVAVLEKDWEIANSKWHFNPRGFAAWALGRLGADAKDAVAPLAKAMHGPDLWARRPAAWALSRLGPAAEPATDALIKALAQDTGGAWAAMNNAHHHAAAALVNIGKPAVPALRKALDSKDPATRRGAAEALGRMGPEVAGGPGKLIAMTIDKDVGVRRAAAVAAIRLDDHGDSFTAQSVSLMLQQKDYADRVAGAHAMGLVNRLSEAHAELLSHVAATDPRPEVRYAATRALRGQGAEE